MISSCWRYLVVLLIFLSFAATGQSVEQIKLELSYVNTIPEAHEYLESHERLIGEILTITEGIDTTALDHELILSKKGDLTDFDSDDQKTHFFYKTLATTYVNSFRVQYIFMDDWEIPKERIDSLRGIILKRLNDGESFAVLAKTYSTDVNSKKGGDRGWFEEGRMPELERRVKDRKVGEVFTFEVPLSNMIKGLNYNWFYVVKKTHPIRVAKKITLLYLEVKNP